MSEDKLIPSLTLTPQTGTASLAELADAAAQSAPDSSGEAIAQQPQEALPAASKNPDADITIAFTPAEQEAIASFAAQIDINNADQVLMYGAAAQQKVAEFSDSALGQVRAKDMGDPGEMLTGLVSQLKSMDFSGQGRGVMRLFDNAKRRALQITAQFDKVSVNVDNISIALEQHQLALLKDVATLDRLYAKNRDYFRELSMYISAGEARLDQVRQNQLPELFEAAKQSSDPMDAQRANDFSENCNRFEKKLFDLKLTRNVALQMAPQIRMIQNNDSLLVEKIQSSLVNTIPLWKSQMVIALGLHRSEEAMKAQRAVTDMTNELLRKNAESLKQSTIAVAQEGERGIVDIETLKATNDSMIQTIDEVMKIQAEGRAQRAAAEKELAVIETELKQKLIDARSGSLPRTPQPENDQ